MRKRRQVRPGIDLGTSGLRPLSSRWYGEVAASEFQETPVILMPGGGAEQDPEIGWQHHDGGEEDAVK
jgi:sugar (pentulose or hexulose) kinase